MASGSASGPRPGAGTGPGRPGGPQNLGAWPGRVSPLAETLHRVPGGGPATLAGHPGGPPADGRVPAASPRRTPGSPAQPAVGGGSGPPEVSSILTRFDMTHPPEAP